MEINYKDLLNTYINNEIENLVLYIHKTYPKIIKKKDVKYLLKKYTSNNIYTYKKYDYEKKKKNIF